jgi:DNA polymerase III epsilon subunit-like protein
MFFDVETTGLPRDRNAPYTNAANWPRIVSIAWIISDGQGSYYEEYYSLVKPSGFTIPPESERVHGISTDKALAEGAELDHVLRKLHEWWRPVGKLVAHNMSFDRNVLFAEIYQSWDAFLPLVKGIPPRECEASARINTLYWMKSLPAICTMKSSTDFCAITGKFGHYKWPSLEELYRKLFHQDLSGQHNAQHDVRATMKCYFELVRLGIPLKVEAADELDFTREPTQHDLDRGNVGPSDKPGRPPGRLRAD